MCPDGRSNPQPWHVRLMLKPTELPGQGPCFIPFIFNHPPTHSPFSLSSTNSFMQPAILNARQWWKEKIPFSKMPQIKFKEGSWGGTGGGGGSTETKCTRARRGQRGLPRGALGVSRECNLCNTASQGTSGKPEAEPQLTARPAWGRPSESARHRHRERPDIQAGIYLPSACSG